jgi:hypothetical protein
MATTEAIQSRAILEACPVQASISGSRDEIMDEAVRRIPGDSK